MPRPRIVIVGGGFAGLQAAQTFANAPVDVTLVDRRNHHLFQPLLYQVATAVLSPADIAQPIRSLLRGQANVDVEMAEVTAVDLTSQKVILADGELAYDYLILAAGATHSYFGHDEWQYDAPGLKTLEDAVEIRRRILLAFEKAERETDPVTRQALLTFVVVGGGPTGVELAGAIAEIAHQALVKDYHNFDPNSARVLLVEALDRLLLAYPPSLSQKALEALQELGVEVLFKQPVTAISPGLVRIGEQDVPAETIIWSAGVAASPLSRTLGVEIDRAGRIKVNRDLSVPEHPNVFIAGDLASVTNSRGKPVPGVAPAAMQEGKWAAKNILRRHKGLPTLPFVYQNKGNLATIGRNSAVADIRGLRFSGFLAWLAWSVIHIYGLIGFHNRLLVAILWLWGYISFKRGARLITGWAKPPTETAPAK